MVLKKLNEQGFIKIAEFLEQIMVRLIQPDKLETASAEYSATTVSLDLNNLAQMSLKDAATILLQIRLPDQFIYMKDIKLCCLKELANLVSERYKEQVHSHSYCSNLM